MKKYAFHYSLCKKYLGKKSFHDVWNTISFNTSSSNNDNKKENKDDQYFLNSPLLQDSLTESHQIFRKDVEYSNFKSISNIDTKNLFECFQGILSYIYYYSENKFNPNELEFHFSGARNYNKSTLEKKTDKSNIMNIFNYEKIDYQFTIKCEKNAFFGVTFKRIKMTPIAYSIRSGSKNTSSSNLISFTFEGFDEINKKWDILDERINSNKLNKDGSFSMFYTRYTEKSYSSFKIVQKQPGSNGFWGFSIAGFDVHGIVSLNEKKENKLINDIEKKPRFSDIIEYDPVFDMSTFLF